MTERLDRIEALLDRSATESAERMTRIETGLERTEASIEETQDICRSNARSLEAYAEKQREFENRFNSFIQRMDSDGLTIRLLRDISDDHATEQAYIGDIAEDNELRFQNLRADAIADRLAFREQAEADRQAFREALEADRAKTNKYFEASNRRFDAQMEIIQRLLLEVQSTNRVVAGLSDRVDELGQVS